jgi:hypothetical protein
VVDMTFPARIADAVVDGDVHTVGHLLGEDVSRGEWITLTTAPSVAPLPAAVHRTLRGSHEQWVPPSTT